MEKRHVVIWGDDHHNALGLLRMLGGQGFEVVFLVQGAVNNIATASKYCTSYHFVRDVREGVDYLLANYTDKENKAVLLVTYDKYSEAVNSNLNRLIEFFYVPGPSIEGSLKGIDDKYTMGTMAQECGIKIPHTYLYPHNNLSEINCFPAVIKSTFQI